MSKNVSMILLVAVIVLIVVILAVYFYFSIYQFRNLKITDVNENITPTQLTKEEMLQKIEEEKQQIKKDFPEIIIGVIKLLDSETNYKATITTDDGKTYTLFPLQPKSIYKSLGIESGQKVQIRAKDLNEDKLEWAEMTPVQ